MQTVEPIDLGSRKNAVIRAWSRQTERGASMEDAIGHIVERLVDFVVGNDSATELLDQAVETHVVGRFHDGFTIDAIVREYALLRRCIHTELMNKRFDHSVDVAIGLAAQHYLRLREDLRERFVGVLAHDLRTPLASVTMASEVMRGDKERSAHERALLDIILDSSDRMGRMVDEVLAWTRNGEAATIPVIRKPDDLGAIVRQVLREIALVHGDDVVSFTSEGTLGGRFDRDRVHRALTNLITNAIQHGAGTAHVEARETDHGETIVMTVRNAGAVRNPASSDVMEPFAGRKRASSSRGLGLYIVDQIVRGHGAGLDIRSSGEETVVTVRWPTRRER